MFYGDLIDEFKSAMAKQGYYPTEIHADGVVHRFQVATDKQGQKSGWYILRDQGEPVGWFGSWKEHDKHKWSYKQTLGWGRFQISQKLDFELCKVEDYLSNKEKHKKARKEACRIWLAAHDKVGLNDYVLRKKIVPYKAKKHGSALVIPIYCDGELVNLQRIYPSSDKRFLTGGQITGCYLNLGEPKYGDEILVCEGWATACTLYQQFRKPVFCAFNAGNLLPVSRYVASKFPNNSLVICGDDDRKTSGNPGKSKALEAAIDVGAKVVFPNWPKNAPIELSDFNDLHCFREVA